MSDKIWRCSKCRQWNAMSDETCMWCKSSTRTMLTKREAAHSLSVSTSTIDRLLAKRELGKIRVGRVVRIPSTDIESFINRHRVGKVR